MAAGLPKSEYGCQLWKGLVSSAGSKRHTLRVRFPEIDPVESFDLPILVPFGGDYVIPAPDTPVACIILDGESGVGFVLGAFYTDASPPPLDNKDARAIDGTDIRIGDPEATDEAALAPATNDNFGALWGVLDAVFGATSSPIVTPAPGSPDPVYTAVKAAIAAKQLAGDLPPVDVAAENVRIK